MVRHGHLLCACRPATIRPGHVQVRWIELERSNAPLPVGKALGGPSGRQPPRARSRAVLLPAWIAGWKDRSVMVQKTLGISTQNVKYEKQINWRGGRSG